MSAAMVPERDDPALAWRRGVRLSFAWLKLAPPAQRSLFQGGGERRRSIQFSMVADLWERLEAGKLLAIGVQTAPACLIEPSYLPGFMFVDAPPGLLEGDVVQSTGVSFEHVRVVRRPRSISAKRPPLVRAMENRPKLGRRDLYPLCQPILRELAEEFSVQSAGDWHRMPSAERLHDRFAKLYDQRHGPSHSPAPSTRSLQKYLSAFRQELAANGNK